MDLNHVLDRDVEVLSGGELQRFAIGVVAVQNVSQRPYIHQFKRFHHSFTAFFSRKCSRDPFRAQ